MQTLTITVSNSKALRLLKDLEDLNLIHVLKMDIHAPKQKLSDRLYGSLSDKQTETLHKELEQMRNEWSRDI
jgi:wyosine [tRNA(Phe)-imidazoG37] synthetase (radical SAM superfamily)